MTTKQKLLLTLTAGLAMAGLSTGCTHVIKNPKTSFTGYRPAERIGLKVGVNLTDDLRKAEWKKHRMGDTWVFRPGGYLCANTLNLAEHVFLETEDMGKSSAETARPDVVLTPKVTYLNRTMPATRFGENITSVKVEYTLTDSGGKLVWIETITGESRVNRFLKYEEVFQRALEDMLVKSQNAMLASEAIRAHATKRKARASQ